VRDLVNFSIVTRSKDWFPITSLEKQDIAKRYSAGETRSVLCKEYRCGRETLKQILREAGIEIRSRPGYAKGTVWSPEWRDAHKQGVTTPENRQRAREALIKRLPSMTGPATNTPIEQRLHDALKYFGIGFRTQKLLLGRHLVDILVNQAPIVIEADGIQHQLRDNAAKDRQRDAELVGVGYRVFRFTGREINHDAVTLIQRVIDECRLVPDENPVYDIRTKFTGEDHPNFRRQVSAETRAKMSKSARNRKTTRYQIMT
jgi:very-short-patch-repair endonuclease